MLKNKRISTALLVSLCMIAFSGCNSGQQKQNKNDSSELSEEVRAEMLESQNELSQMVSEGFANINDKIRDLNQQIEEQGYQLNEEQNEALDEIQEKRVEVNDRLGEIENVSQEEWEHFRSSFENDLDEIKSKIDGILGEF